ncbi:hypothetical protein [Streptomyces sp. XD-27]|uniref:DUF6290 family protein n=1 Tax=Streptomyces sp. XD-27 TaxID=3062779 RepID=UPI0026F477A4|nr:hypothetical protein [Streptomyces sp. XD-27]WKX70602.1 hypothetical protein Q3Y56_12370 [Streptomyces sp. XD-27]
MPEITLRLTDDEAAALRNLADMWACSPAEAGRRIVLERVADERQAVFDSIAERVAEQSRELSRRLA